MNALEEFEKIQEAWPTAVLRSESGLPAVFLPTFSFRTGGTSTTMDLLLFPQQHQGYITRLFFRNQLSRGQNWRSYFVCGETWWAPSWQNVRADQPWTGMLANHLKAVG